MKRTILAMAVVAAAPLVLAGVNAPPKYVGAKIEGANLTTVTAALDALEQLGKANNQKDIEDCAKCVKDMLKNKRVCLETGTHSSGASSWRSKEAGKCGDAGDVMHINQRTINNSQKVLMYTIAHEWRHLLQSSDKPVPESEVEAYTEGKRILTLCGITTGVHVDWHNKKIQAWMEKAGQVGRTPAHGAKDASDSAHPPREADIFSGEPLFFFGTMEDPATHSVPLLRQDNGNPVDPRDVLILESPLLPNNAYMAIVLGIDAVDHTTGVVQFFETNETQAILLNEIILPNVHPFTGLLHTDPNPQFNRLYILDTLNNQVLVTLPLPADPVGAPFQLQPFPLVTQAQAPKLATALGIWETGQPNAIILSDHDGRATNIGILDEQLVRIVDQNFDGQADQVVPFELHDVLQLVPGFDHNPIHLETSVLIGATPGHTIEIRATNEDGSQILEVLGQGTPGTDYLTTIALSRPLQLGEFVQVEDLDHPENIPPRQVSPCPGDIDLDGDVDGDDFFAYLDLFAADDDAADLDGDGDRDADDFFAYLDLFALGCG
ncbi:MAG: hypothetical protein H6811_07690 [Phycisphaeraceae bacterium]|nr:hypothetical protein [Phycisphaeraceae bacterium]